MLLTVFLINSLLNFLLFAGQANPWALTAKEEQALQGAAEHAFKDRNLWHGKIYQTNTEVVFDNRAQPPERYALLTFYRYDGDMAILLTIRLDKMTVTKVATHQNMPTSLAREEIAEAEKIARGHPEIAKALARYKHLEKIEIDATVALIINSEAPGYRHRVARLAFRDADRNYLPNVPMLDVDLTTGEVRFVEMTYGHTKN